ncbi:hypothetical protein K8S19_13645 [bacterium]|nr:hypothetical protein [bacterium]
MKKSAIKIFLPIIGAGLVLSGLILFKPVVDRYILKFKASNSAMPTNVKMSGASEAWFSQIVKNIQSREFQASKDKTGKWQMRSISASLTSSRM